MVGVLVCKNDGCFEFETADVDAQLTRWSDLKMHLAHALYCEEELFAVASPSEIALYRLPDGESLQELCADLCDGQHDKDNENDDDGDDDSVLEKEQIGTLVVADSRWVLDIFSAPMRRMSDLTQQTDHAIRGMRKSNFMPIGRRMSTMPPGGGGGSTSGFISPMCALGNERFTDTTVAPMGSRASMIGSAVSPTSAAINASSVYHEPYIHIGTWVPLMVKDKTLKGSATSLLSSVLKTSAPASPSHYLSSEYEDVLTTTSRAREYINRFRRVGRPVTILSIQTTLLPLAIACPNAISHQGPRILYEGVYQLSESDAQRGFIQAVRLWFSFDCEQTVSVTKVHGALGLKPLRQQDGWIVVQALPSSPAFDAGMRGDEVFLTHVNGVDVSPHAFPSVGAPKQAQQVSWKESVIPLVEECETCIFTFF